MRASSLLPLIYVAYVAVGCGGDTPKNAGVDAAPTDDGGTGENCFPLSGPSPDLPDAIPSSFTASTPTWMRPTGEVCPATDLGSTAVPFETVCYVNDTGAAIDVQFEVAVDGDLTPAAVIYDGSAIPADPIQCAAVSSDLVIDVADAFYTVPVGATVTLVATLQEPGTGDFQFVITPQ